MEILLHSLLRTNYSPKRISREDYDAAGEELISYRLTSSYWQPAHRIYTEVQGSFKLAGFVRISLKERYQFTHEQSVRVRRADYSRDPEDLDDDHDWDTKESVKDKAAENEQVLRSRLKIGIGPRRWKVSPFVSAEVFSRLDGRFRTDKVRYMVGGEWKINEFSNLVFAYVLNDYRDVSAAKRKHAVSLTYGFKF